jgi:undecaprenyl pyrophosphate phosphatase UppP
MSSSIINSTNREASALSIIQAGLVLAATLAWSDTIKSATEYVYPSDKEKKVEFKILYSIILTGIVLIIFYFINNFKDKIDELQTELEEAKKFK